MLTLYPNYALDSGGDNEIHIPLFDLLYMHHANLIVFRGWDNRI